MANNVANVLTLLESLDGKLEATEMAVGEAVLTQSSREFLAQMLHDFRRTVQSARVVELEEALAGAKRKAEGMAVAQ